MIAASQSQDTRPPAMEAFPNGPSKASMMIAAYRAARLNRRLTLRAAPLPQDDHAPPAAPATMPEEKETNQTAAPASEPDKTPLEPSQSEWKNTMSWPGSTGPSPSARGMVEPVPTAWDGPIEPGHDESSHVGTALGPVEIHLE
jgi:hypothetical protein